MEPAAAPRPVRTKRPSRRAAEAAAAQIVTPAAAAASAKRRSAKAHQIQVVPAVVGAETEGGAAASRSCFAKRRRNPSSPRRPTAKKKTTILRSHPPLTLDPCSKKKKRQDILDHCSNNRGGKRARSTELPCPPPDDNNNSRRGCATNLLDDDDDGPAWLIADPCHGPPSDINNIIWRGCAINLLHDDGAPAPKRPCPPPDSNNNWRDWANLADGPAGLIADRLLAFDVADYVRYRAVCRPWRQSSSEPRSHTGLDRRFHPWRWTMLRDELAEADRRCRFLNTSTGQCVQVDIPELGDHDLLALTPEGLLVLLPKPPLTTVRLLNPLTRHLTELPPLTTLLPSMHHHMILDRTPYFYTCCAAWGSGIASDDSTVVLSFDRLGMLGMAKPGDDHWTLLEYHGDGTAAASLMLAGCFYCVSRNAVEVLELGADQPPHLKVAAKLSMRVCPMAHSVHLVNNSGELMLVHRQIVAQTARNKSGMSYNIYRVDLDTGTLLPVKSLGGRAVFMGMRCSLSVSLECFPSGSISADTIYLSFDVAERLQFQVGAYRLKDGSIERPSRTWGDLVPRPHTLADCLSLSNTVEE